MSWRDDAACKGLDPDMFFLERGETIQEAKAVCSTCPVTADCLEYAVTTNQTNGVWAGTTIKTRQKIRRLRGIKPKYHTTPKPTKRGWDGPKGHLRIEETA